MGEALALADTAGDGLQPPPVAVKAFLILAVLLVVFVVACGKVEVRVWTTGDSGSAAPTTGGSSTYAGGLPAGLGEGMRTIAERRWLRRMNSLCASRNRRENALPSPEDTTRSLGRYAAMTLWIWDDYQRRAARFHAPASYAAEAGWLQQVDSSKRAGIQTVLDYARAQNRPASHAAIDNFGNISSDVHAGLVKIGLTECAQFHP